MKYQVNTLVNGGESSGSCSSRGGPYHQQRGFDGYVQFRRSHRHDRGYNNYTVRATLINITLKNKPSAWFAYTGTFGPP
jgi:hypothetical protein